MEKVIVVNASHTDSDKTNGFTEREYPILNKYLSEGYSVRSITPITLTNASATNYYSVVFNLYKS